MSYDIYDVAWLLLIMLWSLSMINKNTVFAIIFAALSVVPLILRDVQS